MVVVVTAVVVVVEVDIATFLQCSIYYHYTTTTLYQFNLFRMNSTNAVSSRAQRPILKKNLVLYLSDKFWYSRDRTPTVRPSEPQVYQCII